MSEVDLSLPLLDLSSVNGALEEKYLRTRLVCSHVKGVAKSAGGNGEELEFLRKDAEMDKMILQLIQVGLVFVFVFDGVVFLTKFYNENRMVVKAINSNAHSILQLYSIFPNPSTGP